MNLAVSIMPRKRLRGKQSPPANYPEYPPVSPMQDCGLGATIFIDYLAKPFVACGVTVPGEDSRAAESRLQRSSFDGRVEAACIALSRMRRCCRAMDALIAPALARSGLYGVCFLRYKGDMRFKPNALTGWPQPEWHAAHRTDPAAARQLAIAWNTDGSTRPRSTLEELINKRSLPRGFVIIDPNRDPNSILSLTDEEEEVKNYRARQTVRRRRAIRRVTRWRAEAGVTEDL